MREAGELVEHNVFDIEIFSLKVKKTENEVEMAQKLGSFWNTLVLMLKAWVWKLKKKKKKKNSATFALAPGRGDFSNVDLLT